MKENIRIIYIPSIYPSLAYKTFYQMRVFCCKILNA